MNKKILFDVNLDHILLRKVGFEFRRQIPLNNNKWLTNTNKPHV